MQRLYTTIQWSRQILFLFFPKVNNKKLGQIILDSLPDFQNTFFFYH